MLYIQVLVNGLVLSGGVVVRAFAGSANVLLLTGYINRISP